MNVPQVYRMPKGYKGDTYISPEFRKVNEILPELVAGLLEVGEEYLIKDYKAGDDFTDIGADKNETGVIFTASATTPTVWTAGSVLVKIQNISLVGASIEMLVYKGGSLVHTFTTTNGSIEIVDEAKGIFKLQNTLLDFYGDLVYDLAVTLGSGIVKTYFKGSWTVDKDVPQYC
jgi:hypothetical protein